MTATAQTSATAPAAHADLVISDLVVEYSSGGYAVRPIDGLSAHVASGELVLLLGASGCGKTTLLSSLAAILTPTSGEIRLGDIDIMKLSGRALTRYRRETVGVVFQAFNLVPSLDAVENLLLPMRAARVKSKIARERAEKLLGQVGLEHRLHHRPGDMSGGQQQRVAIARALVHDPPLILADEPTAHLDYIQVEGVIRLLRDLATPGRIVVVATHDERMIPLADRVIELSARATPDSGPPEEITLAAGDVLFHQGDSGNRVFVVQQGEIELFRELAEGGREQLAVVRDGDYFGELAPLFGLRRAATALATTATVVMSYSTRDFRAVVHPGSVADLISRAPDRDDGASDPRLDLREE
jgi:putative ABC transport system ATP-binding protein